MTDINSSKRLVFPTMTLADAAKNPLLDQMQTALVCCGADLQIYYANSAAETLLHASQHRLEQLGINHFLQEVAQLSDLVERAITNHQSFSLRDLRLTPYFLKNETRLVDMSVTPISSDSTPVKDAQLLFEITPKDRQSTITYEAQLSQQHAVTRQMIRGVAHEIKNPLAGIRGAAQLLQRELAEISDSTDADEYTDVIIAESDRLKSLANSMLGSHKLPNMSETNIHEPLEHVWRLLSTQFPDIKLVRDYDSSLPELQCDKQKLIQVILNISLNAAQALTEHNVPEPKLTYRTRIAHHITIAGLKHRKLIDLSIMDNGVGIDAELQKTLFYPMVSGRAQGTGLGLSIAQDIVQQHYGMISCQSREGHTCFRILLPLQPPSSIAQEYNYQLLKQETI